jgi:hypothetical protein
MATITKTVKPSGGDYTSLSNWEAGEQADLVAAGNIAVAECYSMVDTTPVVVDGWTTGVNNYIQIEGAASDRTSSNTGLWSTSRYRLVTTGTGEGSDRSLTINTDYVYLRGLQISRTNGLYNCSCIYMTGLSVANRVEISDCILRYVSKSNEHPRAVTSDWPSNANIYFYNNICYNFIEGSTGYAICFSSTGYCYAYNNTFVNCSAAIFNSDDTHHFICTNNIFSSCPLDIDLDGGNYVTDTYCSTTNDNTKGLTPAGTGNRFSQTFTFVNAGAGDYHLAATDAGARTYGVTDPGAGLFSDDIDGQTRAAPWDIGADQYVSINADITLALTGVAGTSAAGTVTPQESFALTGNAGTASPGTVALNIAIALTGISVAVSAGTVAQGKALPIIGIGSTASDGTVTPQESFAITNNLGTTSLGTVALNNDLALSGIALTAPTGAMMPGLLFAFTGNIGTSASGALAKNYSVAITGSELTSSSGDILSSNALALTGTEATTVSGSITPGIGKALTGVSATSAVGDIGKTFAITISGSEGTASPGTMTASQGLNITLALTGIEATAYAGNLSPSGSSTLALTGIGATTSAGTLKPGNFVPLTSVPSTAFLGPLSKSTTTALMGTQGTAQAGTITPSSGDIILVLTGIPAVTFQGAITPNVSVNLIGNGLVSNSGTISTNFNIALSGISSVSMFFNWQNNVIFDQQPELIETVITPPVVGPVIIFDQQPELQTTETITI